MLKILDKLKDFTIKGDSFNIYNYLNQDIGQLYKNELEKGSVLEHYLKYLYELYGFMVIVKGGAGDRGVDLEVYSKSDLKNPINYIQVKNHKKAKNIDNIADDLQKFQSKYGTSKAMESKFKFFSLNGFTKDTKNLIGGRLKIESFDDIKYLIDSYSSQINRLNANEILTYITNLMPHNEYAYRNAIEMSKTHDKVCIVQPTGTGKMYIANQLIVDFALKNRLDAKALFVAPNYDIIKKIKLLCPVAKTNIEYMTYAKVANLTPKQIQDYNFQEIYLDEFHRKGAKTWSEGIDMVIRNSINLLTTYGLTATPERYNGLNMADDFFNNNFAQNMSLPEAISRDLIQAPKYVSALYSIKEEVDLLKESIDSSNLSDIEKEKSFNRLKIELVNWENSFNVDKVLKKYIIEQQLKYNEENGRFIVFCQDKVHMETMELEVKKWFNKTKLYKRINSFAISTDYGEKYNNEQLELFEADFKLKGECKLLFSIDKLNEGLHVKDINGVLLLRSTKSNIIFSQQIGRALSVGDKKQSIIFDLVNNFQRVNVNTKSCQSFYDEVENANNRERQARSDLGLYSKEYQSVEIFDELKDIINVFQDIRTNFINFNSFSEKKDFFIEKIRIFIKNNNCLPNKRLEGEDGFLGRWISTQKVSNFRNLSEDQKNKLIAIIENESQEERRNGIVNENIKYIINFKREYSKVPRASTKKPLTNNELYLGQWLCNQKKYNYKHLSKSQKEELIFIIGNESKEEKYNQIINENIEHIANFQREYLKLPRGKTNKPLTDNELYLGQWIGNQKQKSYKNLSKDQKNKLIDIIGNESKEEKYNQIIESILKFMIEYSKLPRGKTKEPLIEHELYLGGWISKQKHNNYKNLSKKQKEELLNIIYKKDKFNNLLNNEKIDKNIVYISEFKEKHLRIPRTKAKDPLTYNELYLGNWISIHRRNNYNDLSKEQEKKLLNIIS